MEKFKTLNISDFNFEEVHRLRYTNQELKQDVPLLYVEKITNSNYLQYDMLMVKHYGRGGEKYLKLVLMFNNMYDVTSITVGDLLLIPDIQSLLDICTYIDTQPDTSIVGFEQLTVQNKNKVNTKVIPSPKDKRKTTASPRLLITMEQPKFDSETGIIKY